MKITIDTNNLTQTAIAALGEIEDKRGRSAALVSAINGLARELAHERAAHAAVSAALEDAATEVAELEASLTTMRQGKAERAATLDRLANELVETKRALSREVAARRGEALFAAARADLRKAHEVNARLEAELILLKSEKEHLRREWGQAVAEERAVREDRDKLKEELSSTSST